MAGPPGTATVRGVTDSSVRGIRCVGAVVYGDGERLLLVRRAHAPGRGLWSLPGGHVEPGETDQQAVAREVLEETAITVDVGRHVGSVTRSAPEGAVFEIHDYACRAVAGTVQAGGDAADARWCDPVEFAALPLVEGLLEVLSDWDCLPR